jgi:hypothetical protein
MFTSSLAPIVATAAAHGVRGLAETAVDKYVF